MFTGTNNLLPSNYKMQNVNDGQGQKEGKKIDGDIGRSDRVLPTDT